MGGRYVGVDLHRRRSVIYTMDADGERLECVRIANDPLTLLETVSAAGPDAEVVIEADLWLVLGGGPVARRRVQRASLAPVGQRLGEASGQERRTRRA